MPFLACRHTTEQNMAHTVNKHFLKKYHMGKGCNVVVYCMLSTCRALELQTRKKIHTHFSILNNQDLLSSRQPGLQRMRPCVKKQKSTTRKPAHYGTAHIVQYSMQVAEAGEFQVLYSKEVAGQSGLHRGIPS